MRKFDGALTNMLQKNDTQIVVFAKSIMQGEISIGCQ